MAAADVETVPMYIRRTPTCMSLQQNAETYQQPANGDGHTLGCIPQPDAAVMDARGACIPKYSFPALDCKLHATPKRVRSFGDLHQALVPDMGYGSEDCCGSLEMSVEGGSSDGDGDQVVPHMPGTKAAGVVSKAKVTPSDGLAVLSKTAAAAGNPAAPLQMGLLDTILRTEWDDRKAQGLFRYNVAGNASMMVPGEYGFVTQLNEGRATKKRPTEFRVDQVAQAFDGNKFNFTKALQKEVLCQFEASLERFPAFTQQAVVKGSPHLVYINVSPIEYGHVLLVPRVLDCIPQVVWVKGGQVAVSEGMRWPQVVDPDTVLLALNFLRQVNNPYFRAGFNSLGAYGTINHLHFQAYYLASPFPIERADTEPVPGLSRPSGPISISQLSGYPVRGLVFETSGALAALAAVVGSACRRLTEANVPHNLFIVDRGARVFLLPNAFAERKAKGLVPEHVLATQVDPACFELSGHLVLKRTIDFEEVTQESCWELLECASLDEQCFAEAVTVALPALVPCSRRSPSSRTSFSGRLSGSFSTSGRSSGFACSGDMDAVTAANTAANAVTVAKPPPYGGSTAPAAFFGGTFETAVPTMGRRATAGDTPRRKSTSVAPPRHSGTFMRV